MPPLSLLGATATGLPAPMPCLLVKELLNLWDLHDYVYRYDGQHELGAKDLTHTGLFHVITYILGEPGHEGRPDEHVADDQGDDEHYEECHLSVHPTFKAELGGLPEGIDQLAEGCLYKIPLHPVKLAKSLRIYQLVARIP
jgi:hypothetical protein